MLSLSNAFNGELWRSTITPNLCALRHHLGMALINFCGLVALYELRRSDAGFPSVPSHSLMSSTRSSHSSSLSDEPEETRSPLPPTQPEFKTPERKSAVSHPVPDITPLSLGSAMRQTQEDGADRVKKFNRADYDGYIREDLGSRVFVDFEVFMKCVLHVPDDWRSAWGPAIEAVKADTDFIDHHKAYCGKCNKSDEKENSFYPPLMKTANAALSILSRLTSSGISPGVPQYYHKNDPKKLRGGVINKFNLSPDIVVLHEDCRPSEEKLHWANPLYVLEVKPYDNAICDGLDVPRLVVNGKGAQCALSVFGVADVRNRS